jgi:hypothetical protein
MGMTALRHAQLLSTPRIFPGQTVRPQFVQNLAGAPGHAPVLIQHKQTEQQYVQENVASR